MLSVVSSRLRTPRAMPPAPGFFFSGGMGCSPLLSFSVAVQNEKAVCKNI